MKIKKGSILIDINKPEQEIFQSFSKNKRYDIKKAQEQVQTIDIYQNKTIFQAHKNHKIVSIIVTETKNNTTKYISSLNHPDYKKYNFNNLLLWESMKHAKAQGCNTFDLGGIDLKPTKKQEGINNFKKSFQGRPTYWEEKVNLLIWMKWTFKKYFKK